MDPSSVSIVFETEVEACIPDPSLYVAGCMGAGVDVEGVGAADEFPGVSVDEEGGFHDEGLGRRDLKLRLLSPNSQ